MLVFRDNNRKWCPFATQSNMTDWKAVGIRLALIIVFGILITLVALVIVGLLARNAPCKNSSTCAVGQTCDQESGHCKSLPGSTCSNNSQCSVYAPLCQQNGHYCTNIASQGRGTSGNPPRTGGGSPCDAGLVLNSIVNLCQQLSIGASCTMDAQCNQGLCDQNTKTCQYATTHCTTDTTLNPTQCQPPYECNAISLACTIQGTTPGGDGTPCTSNAECAPGNTCVFGPAGSGSQGVCHSGLATWLLLLGEVPGEDRCMPPLAEGTGWCRYDVKTFMQCSTSLDCQYPYAICSGLGVCDFAPGVIDPIDPAKFPYFPVGYTGGVGVTGTFYTASFPLPQPPAENPTGGKLLDQYLAFVPLGQQFETQPFFDNSQFVTFSRYTSFIVTSMAAAATPPNPPQIPYHTAIFSDPNPSIVTTAIVRRSADSSKSGLVFSLYTPPSGLKPQQVGGNFNNSNARIWNPRAVSIHNPDFPPVAFIENPIITSWIDITVGPSAPPPQSFMIHSLIYAEGHYMLGFLVSINVPDRFGPITVIETALLVPTLNGVPVDTDTLLITSWDAITTWYQRRVLINTTVIMYGLNAASGQYFMGVAQIGFTTTGGGTLSPQVTSGPNQIPIILNPVPTEMQTPTTQCHLTRASGRVVEPLLTLAIFFIVPDGLQVSSFSINTTDGSFDLGNSQCSGSQVLQNVSSLLSVTPVTGAYNYGSFVVWCSTAETREAFLVVQVNAFCILGPPLIFNSGLIYSAVYWRRLTSDPPDNYFVYPVGGASLPFFIAISAPLDFDGTPTLQPF